MSSIINIYEPNAEDFDCEGLGTLNPMDWEYNNKGIGGAVLTIKHPYDDDGKWQLIQPGRIIRADVPVRTVPEIENGALVATAEQWTVSRGATKAQRYIYSSATNGKGKKKKLVPPAATVTVTKQGDDRYAVTYRAQVRNKKKKLVWKAWSGWMDRDALDVKIKDLDTSTVAAVEKAIPSVQVRPQLFRLQQPKRKLEEIEVEALPIAYDAAGILTDPYIATTVTGPQVLSRILSRAYISTDLELYTDIGDSRTAFEKRNVNIIDALLNGDDSFVGRFGGDVLFDDYTITILRNAGVDRGFYATYGRNLTGIESYEVSDDVVTAILPVGENANGDPLYLAGTPYVRSANYDQFPIPHMVELKVSDARVNKKEGVTVAIARARMQEAVAAEWEKGVHIPPITLRIDYAMLGDSEEYKAFRAVDQCHMYDIVHIWHPLVCGYVDMAVCETTWNGMKERYTETVLGTPGGTLSKARISANSISGSISGRQIAWNAIGAGQLADDCIEARHIQADSINTDALQANAVTANKLAAGAVDAQAIAALTATINAITAGDISTNTLSAAFAHLMQVVADNIQAGTVTADALDAVMASIVSISVGAATFDLAEIQNLLASALVLDEGQAGSMHITNLAVTSANLLNATVGKLVIKGDDGSYYEVGVGSDGVIRTAQYDATAQEIADGRTTDGRQIVTETINAEAITGETVKAQEAVLNRVLTAALTAGQITANDAMLASASIPLLYATSIRALGNSLDISANQSIRLLVGNVNAIGEDIRRMIRIEQDGLHVGDSQTTNEVLIDSESVNVVLGGFKYSKFAADYVQFGDYQLRRSVDGGLVFKKA